MSRHAARRPSSVARAFTLVEMLIAMALTMILVIAIAEFYAFLGDTVKDGRATIEMSGQLRTAFQRLKGDLDQITVPVVPWADDAAGHGYFTIGEGRGKDADWDGDGTLDVIGPQSLTHASAGISNLLGDVDDYIGFTARAKGEPWVGQIIEHNDDGTPVRGTFNGLYTVSMASSQVAEIAWWTSYTEIDNDGLWDYEEPRAIHRRLMLVRPDLNELHPTDLTLPSTPYFIRLPAADIAEAYYNLLQNCDISIRPLTFAGGHAYFVANSLSDLTRRENRFMHVYGLGNFPNYLDLNPHKFGDPSLARHDTTTNFNSLYRWVLAGDRKGEDVILSNVFAFDVRVFDPTAALLANGATGATGVIQPGDVGWETAVTGGATVYPPVGQGAYVDLYYNRYPALAGVSSRFSGVMATKSQMANPANTAELAYYDTWAQSYERDGMNQGGALVADSGTNGLDDDGVNGVDDPAERDTDPPYAAPLRGIEIKVRLYEPGTRQMRQATVGVDFLPE